MNISRLFFFLPKSKQYLLPLSFLVTVSLGLTACGFTSPAVPAAKTSDVPASNSAGPSSHNYPAQAAPINNRLTNKEQHSFHIEPVGKPKILNGIPNESLSSTADWQTATEVPILMYHSISHNPKNTLCVDPVLFQEELLHLKNQHYTPITFEDLQIWTQTHKLPAKPVLLTLDDGYRDNYTNAYPVFKSLQFKATIFLITGFIGSHNSLTWDQIDEMQKSGLVEFGAHTVHHLDLTHLSDLDRHQEITESKLTLDAHFGHPTLAFCYPSGRLNPKTIKDVQDAGYQFAVTTVPGMAHISQGLFTLDRIRIPGNLSLASFEKEFQ